MLIRPQPLRLAFLVMSLVVALVAAAPGLAAQAAAAPADIDRLVGAGWTGTLTYRDYSTEARTTIKAALLLTRIAAVPAGTGAQWELRIAYADEPRANSGDTIALSHDGHRFREATVTECQALADGTVRLVTEEEGEDNERPAHIRLVYLIGEHAASIQKLVRYEGGTYFERHIYEWRR